LKIATVIVEKTDGTLSTVYVGRDRAEAKAKAKEIAIAKPAGTSAVVAFAPGVQLYSRVWARGVVEAPKAKATK
jgi:hypothetical protein